MKIQSGDLPEEPPAGYDALGLHPAYSVKRLPTKAEIDAYCRANRVSAADKYVKRAIDACVIPSRHEVVLPEQGVLRPQVAKATEVHEYAHSWGLQHGSGSRGWINGAGTKAKSLTPAQAEMLMSMARAQQRLMTASAKPVTDYRPTTATETHAGPPRGLMTSSARQFVRSQ